MVTKQAKFNNILGENKNMEQQSHIEVNFGDENNKTPIRSH